MSGPPDVRHQNIRPQAFQCDDDPLSTLSLSNNDRQSSGLPANRDSSSDPEPPQTDEEDEDEDEDEERNKPATKADMLQFGTSLGDCIRDMSSTLTEGLENVVSAINRTRDSNNSITANGPTSTPQARPSALESKPPKRTGLRQRRPKELNSFRADIRKKLKVLLPHGELHFDPSDIEATAFAQRWDPNVDGINSCDRERFRIYLGGTPTHPWNQSAARIFADILISDGETPYGDGDRMKIQAALSRAGGEEERNKANRRRERKAELFQRRLRTVLDVDQLRHHSDVLERLGVDGMSSDEEVQTTNFSHEYHIECICYSDTKDTSSMEALHTNAYGHKIWMRLTSMWTESSFPNCPRMRTIHTGCKLEHGDNWNNLSDPKKSDMTLFTIHRFTRSFDGVLYIRSLHQDESTIKFKLASSVSSLCWHPDRERLTLFLGEIEREHTLLNSFFETLQQVEGAINAIAVDGELEHLVLAYDGNVAVYTLETGSRARSLAVLNPPVDSEEVPDAEAPVVTRVSVKKARNDTILIVGYLEHGIRAYNMVWDEPTNTLSFTEIWTTGKRRGRYFGSWDVVVSDNYSLVVVHNLCDGLEYYRWQESRRQAVYKPGRFTPVDLRGPESPIYPVAFVADGEKVVYGSENGRVCVVNAISPYIKDAEQIEILENGRTDCLILAIATWTDEAQGAELIAAGSVGSQPGFVNIFRGFLDTESSGSDTPRSAPRSISMPSTPRRISQSGSVGGYGPYSSPPITPRRGRPSQVPMASSPPVNPSLAEISSPISPPRRGRGRSATSLANPHANTARHNDRDENEEQAQRTVATGCVGVMVLMIALGAWYWPNQKHSPKDIPSSLPLESFIQQHEPSQEHRPVGATPVEQLEVEVPFRETVTVTVQLQPTTVTNYDLDSVIARTEWLKVASYLEKLRAEGTGFPVQEERASLSYASASVVTAALVLVPLVVSGFWYVYQKWAKLSLHDQKARLKAEGTAKEQRDDSKAMTTGETVGKEEDDPEAFEVLPGGARPELSSTSARDGQ
ncbi:hypothetical protein K435DRAFT_867780 [Dendrothele bispora CBS 962.96]|uniref:Uncharacterized protein n=1 Tax=Dendrothele bispora (strain CBS 962.96) TaxID=1314807 RepID=A0A4S8LE47_DENBC|nr:hypothetical protein K435DRAFT_867780 [Dendrothele bispora CBS 962.96]